MKLLVPSIGEPRPADARLIRLAEFLGIHCDQISLTETGALITEAADTVNAKDGSCLVINPEVIREWAGGNAPSDDFASTLVSSFRGVLIHAVRPDPFHSELVRSLTAGRFQAVQRVADSEDRLTVASDSKDVCGPYAGVSVCKANSENDRTFTVGKGGRNLISIGGEAHFAVSHLEKADVFLLGSEDVADLDSEVGEDCNVDLFSRFVPHAMALRYVFGDQCWRPFKSHACVIVDDPLMRPNYGFLDFHELLRMIKQHNFSTTLAFIPHNFRRSSAEGVRIFRDNSDRLSLCYHGNDHTGAEFATTDRSRLDTMIQSAEHRMTAFTEATRVHCDRVMVFPQGKFSVEAMAALRAHNFEAAVNTESHPWRDHILLTLREVAQPAVLRYAGFPLFLRKNGRQMQDTEIAFRLFFGIPLLIGEHHDTFHNPQSLVDAVTRINKAAPEIIWSSAGAAARGSVLHRRDTDGSLHVKAYARAVRVEIPSQRKECIHIHWGGRGREEGLESVQRNGVPGVPFHSDDFETCASAVLELRTEEQFSIHFREEQIKNIPPMSLRYNAGVFVRRRLSEIRDNHISGRPLLLSTTKALQKLIWH